MAKQEKPKVDEDGTYDFTWEDAEKDGEVIVQNQDAIAVYLNPYKHIVLRQERRGEEDHIVYIPKSEARAVIKAIQALLKKG